MPGPQHRSRVLLLLVCAQGCLVTEDVSALAPLPDWNRLHQHDGAMTRERFTALLHQVYAPGDAWRPVLSVEQDRLRVRAEHGNVVDIPFAAAGSAPVAGPAVSADPKRPLQGVRVALDPGHVGGPWARVEGRWFSAGGTAVAEGDMTLEVARLLEPRLRALGARVLLVRDRPAPVTTERPPELRAQAPRALRQRATAWRDRWRLGLFEPAPDELDREAERLFYRVSEIRARAARLQSFRPDVTVCLHFNAEAWGDDEKATLVDGQHLHTLVNGAYSRQELALQDVRADMLHRLLSGTHEAELGLNTAVAAALARATALPPFAYDDGRAVRAGPSPYVWARNLLANRLYPGPVVFAEPYVMNSRELVQRVAAGDYEGVRAVAGAPRKSLVREYADAVAEGLAAWFSRGAS